MGFCSLQHLRHRRSASRGLSPAHHVPPSGFGYPHDGLLPSKPCRFCFAPAALLGFALRSFLLAAGNRAVSDSEEPTYRSLVCIPLHRSAGAGSTSRGFWALTQPASPWRSDVCLVRRLLVAPLGFTLPRSSQKPGSEFLPISSHVLLRHDLRRTDGTSESRSASASSHPPARTSRSGKDEKPS